MSLWLRRKDKNGKTYYCTSSFSLLLLVVVAGVIGLILLRIVQAIW